MQLGTAALGFPTVVHTSAPPFAAPVGHHEEEFAHEALLRRDVIAAVGATADIYATYVGALRDAVLSYVAILRQRGVSRSDVQARLTRLVVEATNDEESLFLLHVTRWIEEEFTGSSAS